MHCSNNAVYNKIFSHIYIEEAVLDHPRTKRILSHFPAARQILCRDYKDIFSRTGQHPHLQRHSRSLILAHCKLPALHPGARVCQDFGNANFYYTSQVMNCLFDCEYCYLQGMYPSAHLVIFVNLEDTLAEVERLLAQQTMYISISYDTDLLALEPFTGMLQDWIAFAALHPGLLLEVRTKCASLSTLRKLTPSPQIIWAVTLSPEEIISRYEHFTASLAARLTFLKEASAAGFPIRLCFDPMLFLPDFKQVYAKLFRQVFAVIDAKQVLDASIGVFRISKAYLKPMRKNRPCGITYYPYELTNGVYHYGTEASRRMLSFAETELTQYLSPEKLFVWEPEEA